jgi:FtsH-binding integral membrane protein
MWPHYWLGYVLVILVLTHTTLVMGPVMGRTDATGIWAATLALCLLFFQAVLGLLLKGGTSNRRQLRRWHFWTMIGLTGLVLIHVFRNG